MTFTSYDHPGGSGSRMTGQVVSYFHGATSQFSQLSMLDGNLTTNHFSVWPQGTSATYTPHFVYSWVTPRVISEVRLTNNNVLLPQQWILQGSNVSCEGPWTTFESTTTVEGDVLTVSTYNHLPFKFYSLRWMSGSTEGLTALQIEFKICPNGMGWYEPYSSGNRAAIITAQNLSGYAQRLMPISLYSYHDWCNVQVGISPVFTFLEPQHVTGIRIIGQQANNLGQRRFEVSHDKTTWYSCSDSMNITLGHRPANYSQNGYIADIELSTPGPFKYLRMIPDGTTYAGDNQSTWMFRIGDPEFIPVTPFGPGASGPIRRRQLPFVN